MRRVLWIATAPVSWCLSLGVAIGAPPASSPQVRAVSPAAVEVLRTGAGPSPQSAVSAQPLQGGGSAGVQSVRPSAVRLLQDSSSAASAIRAASPGTQVGGGASMAPGVRGNVDVRPGNVGPTDWTVGKAAPVRPVADSAMRNSLLAADELHAAREAALIQSELGELQAGGLQKPGFDAPGADPRMNMLGGLGPGGGVQDDALLDGIDQTLGGKRHDHGKSALGNAISAPDPGSFGVGGDGLVMQGGDSPGRSSDGLTKEVNPISGGGTEVLLRRGDRIVERSETHEQSDGTTRVSTTREGYFRTEIRSADGRTMHGVGSMLGEDGVWRSQSFIGRVPAGGTEMVTTYGRVRVTPGGPDVTPPSHNVDPDSGYGQGSGKVVGPGQKAEDPAMVRARRGGGGPGARPDDNAAAGGVSRLAVDLGSTVVNPPPGEATGGGGPAHRGFNPASTRDDDFGPRAN